MSKKKEKLADEQVNAEAAGAQENASAEQSASEQQQEVTTEVKEENPTEELQKQLDFYDFITLGKFFPQPLYLSVVGGFCIIFISQRTCTL